MGSFEIRAFNAAVARRLPPGLHGRPFTPAAATKPNDAVTRRQLLLAGVNAAAYLALTPTALAKPLSQTTQPHQAKTSAGQATRIHPALPAELWNGKIGDVKEALAADPLFIDHHTALLVTLLYRHHTIPNLEAFGPADRYLFRYYEFDFIDGTTDVGPIETGLFPKSPYANTNSGILKLGALFADPAITSSAIFLHRTGTGLNGVTGQRYTLGGSFAPLSPAESLAFAQPFWQNGRYEFPIWGEYSDGLTFSANQNSTYSYFDDPTAPPNNQDELRLLVPQQQILWRQNFTPYYGPVYGEQPAYYQTPNQKTLLAVHRSGVMSGIDRNSY